jgi:septal ring factor EnvC (AmiA/AmiB activator)
MNDQLEKIITDLRKSTSDNAPFYRRVADEFESLARDIANLNADLAKLEAQPWARRAKFKLVLGGKHA